MIQLTLQRIRVGLPETAMGRLLLHRQNCLDGRFEIYGRLGVFLSASCSRKPRRLLRCSRSSGVRLHRPVGPDAEMKRIDFVPVMF